MSDMTPIDEKTGKPIALCERCGNPFVKTQSKKKFCSPCGPHAERERTAERCRERRAADPDGERAKKKAWDVANKEHASEYRRAYSRKKYARHIGEQYDCPDCGNKFTLESARSVRCRPCAELRRSRTATDRSAAWNAANPDRRNARFRERYATDPKFKLDVSMANGIGKSLCGGKSGRPWLSLVSYSLDDLKLHIERQFTHGMTWENWGVWPAGWHIDHIVPRSAFSYTTAEDPQFIACWSMTNLRPLWATENLKKSGKRLFLL